MRRLLTVPVIFGASLMGAQAATEITDAATLQAFAGAVNSGGFNCPSIVSVHRLDYQSERGQPFMVACGGRATGFFYRVTVNPAGRTFVEPWK